MSKSIMLDVSQIVKKFMIEKGWEECLCDACGRTFFSKSSKMKAPVCGWHECDDGTYPFRTFVKRKKLVTPAEVNAKMVEYFGSIGFKLVSPQNIANPDGQTDLIIAGVQMFDNIIHHNHEIRSEKVFVAQPCVRMQFQQCVESQEGTSTSFVNVCTEKMCVEFEEHLRTVDDWFTILSKLGLHMKDFTIIMQTAVNNWGTGEFSALELFFSYGGLELGDASYLLVPQEHRAPISISDIGFGLERVVWAMNKTDSYFETLIPWASDGSREMFDSCRTLALLALCGVRASNKGPGLQFRRFSKVISEKYYRSEVYSIFEYYFNYWSQFIKPHISRDAAIRLMRLEVERFINLEVNEMLKLSPPYDETTEDYLNRLVYTYDANIHEMRKAIQSCKT